MERAEAGVARDTDAVVRPFPAMSVGRSVARSCARPGCATDATATLSFTYAEREVVLAPLTEEHRPQSYDLCTDHAARTRPPRGWRLRDRRPEDTRHPASQPRPPADLGGDRTVAVLAAALRSVPAGVSEDAAADSPPPLVPVVEPHPTLLDPLADPLVVDLVEPAGPLAAGDGSAGVPARPAPRPPLAVRRSQEPAADW